MLASNIPAQKFSIPFANGASGTYRAVIPTASQIGVNDGRASLTDGFPPDTFLAIAAGGIPPDGRDVNGILWEVSGWSRWQQAGGPITYDAAFSTAIGGYPAGAILSTSPAGGLWLSTADNNTTNPDGGGANWVPLMPVKASDAEVIAGTDDDKFITPAGLAAWALAGPQSGVLLAQNGFYTFPGGLIAQWGRFNITGVGNLIVGFPTPFPTACFSVAPGGGQNSAAQNNQVTLVSGSINASQFEARYANAGTVEGTFIAYGV